MIVWRTTVVNCQKPKYKKNMTIISLKKHSCVLQNCIYISQTK